MAEFLQEFLWILMARTTTSSLEPVARKRDAIMRDMQGNVPRYWGPTAAANAAVGSGKLDGVVAAQYRDIIRSDFERGKEFVAQVKRWISGEEKIPDKPPADWKGMEHEWNGLKAGIDGFTKMKEQGKLVPFAQHNKVLTHDARIIGLTGVGIEGIKLDQLNSQLQNNSMYGHQRESIFKNDSAQQKLMLDVAAMAGVRPDYLAAKFSNEAANGSSEALLHFNNPLGLMGGKTPGNKDFERFPTVWHGFVAGVFRYYRDDKPYAAQGKVTHAAVHGGYTPTGAANDTHGSNGTALGVVLRDARALYRGPSGVAPQASAGVSSVPAPAPAVRSCPTPVPAQAVPSTHQEWSVNVDHKDPKQRFLALRDDKGKEIARLENGTKIHVPRDAREGTKVQVTVPGKDEKPAQTGTVYFSTRYLSDKNPDPKSGAGARQADPAPAPALKSGRRADQMQVPPSAPKASPAA